MQKKKQKQKQGISLIVLVITIIVMIILAATIIISLTNSGIITKANEAVFATNVKNYREELSLYLVNKLADNTNYDTKSLNADSTTTPSITDVITSMKEEDKTKFKIVAGTLFYIGDNEEEISSCEQAGVKTKYSELTETEYNEMYKEEIARALACGEVSDYGSFGKYFNLTTTPSATPIALPWGVTTTGYNATLGSLTMEDIIMPSTLTTLNTGAFGFSAGDKIVIPASITNLTDGMYYIQLATEIKVNPNNKVYDSRDNCNAIIETATNTLVRGCKNTIIPQSVTKIGYSAFISVKLSNITIPYGVKSICSYAFGSGITSDGSEIFVIPDSVTNIEYSAFCGGVTGFKTIKLSSNLTKIEDFTFQNCSLEYIVIPASITSIGEGNFNSNLKKVYIESENITLSVDPGGYMTDTFSYLTSDATVYVRNETVASYLADKVGSATISTDYNWVAPTN